MGVHSWGAAPGYGECGLRPELRDENSQLRSPALGPSETWTPALVAQEYRVQYRAGPPPERDEYLRLYPHLAEALPRRLDDIAATCRPVEASPPPSPAATISLAVFTGHLRRSGLLSDADLAAWQASCPPATLLPYRC